MAIEFSKESMEKASEPDKLDSYLCVATPGVWPVVVTAILTVIALALWAGLGEVNGVTLVSALFG